MHYVHSASTTLSLALVCLFVHSFKAVTAADDGVACKDKCLRGNWQVAGWATYPDSPACWKNEGSYFSCFDKINGNCPWGGMTDCTTVPAPTVTPAPRPTPTPTPKPTPATGNPTPAPTPRPTPTAENPTPTPTPSPTPTPTPTTTTKNPTKVCLGVCLRDNNQQNGWASANAGAPPCWKDEGTYFSCFDYLNDKCPEGSTISDCPKSEMPPLCDGWGAYCGTSDCINPARRGCCYDPAENSYFSFWWYVNGQANDECKSPLVRS